MRPTHEEKSDRTEERLAMAEMDFNDSPAAAYFQFSALKCEESLPLGKRPWFSGIIVLSVLVAIASGWKPLIFVAPYSLSIWLGAAILNTFVFGLVFASDVRRTTSKIDRYNETNPTQRLNVSAYINAFIGALAVLITVFSLLAFGCLYAYFHYTHTEGKSDGLWALFALTFVIIALAITFLLFCFADRASARIATTLVDARYYWTLYHFVDTPVFMVLSLVALLLICKLFLFWFGGSAQAAELFLNNWRGVAVGVVVMPVIMADTSFLIISSQLPFRRFTTVVSRYLTELEEVPGNE